MVSNGPWAALLLGRRAQSPCLREVTLGFLRLAKPVAIDGTEQLLQWRVRREIGRKAGKLARRPLALPNLERVDRVAPRKREKALGQRRLVQAAIGCPQSRF